jgi:aminoglycoside phosphotransferase (APT) family kinase protein
MTSDHDLTTEQGLRAYLDSKKNSPTTIQSLTGGTANYVYRVEFEGGHTSIFKHAAPYLSSNRDFAFSSARMNFEATILKAILPLEDISKSDTHAVRLLEYDCDHKLLHIEDGGDRNLKEAYDDPALDIEEIGRRLAMWLANLHWINNASRSMGEPTQETLIGRNNNTIAVQIYRHSYNNLHTALTRYGHDTKLADDINLNFGSLLETDEECVCHGDFWPGNVLVQPKEMGTVLDPTGNLPDLTIVDWEMSRRGTSATDVGQFAAEAFLLDMFRGNRGLRTKFLDSYAFARKSDKNVQTVGKEWIKRMAVHWAVHVAFWPTRVQWTDDQGTKNLVDLGVRVLTSALASDWDGLKASPLFAGLGEDWDAAFTNP